MTDQIKFKHSNSFKHHIGCTCKCGVVKFPDDVVEALAELPEGTQFEYECPEHGTIEHILTKTEKERMTAAKKYPGPTDFVHLHNHTIYSALDGVAKPEEYFRGCEECDLPAFAITDHGSIAGAPDAYFAAKQHKIKYISGCEIYFNDFEPEFKDWQRQTKSSEISVDRQMLNIYNKLSILRAERPEMHQSFVRNRHLTVLCKNMTGYKNLIKINNIANESGFYYKPRIWYDLLKENKEGLIILSGCLNGPVCHELRSQYSSTPASKTIQKRLNGTSAMDKNGYAVPKNIALQWIRQFQEDFGDDFYLELQMPGPEISLGKDAFRMISEISRKLQIKSIISNDCHYLQRDDYKIQLVMMATDQDKKIDDPTLFHVNSNEQFFKTRAQMRQTFIEHGYAQFATIDEFENFCDNTMDVADKCSTFSPDLDPKLPEVDDSDQELTRRCAIALRETGLNNDLVYVDRLKTELQRIIEKKFSSYFLITADIVNESKKRGWPVGPARGSAGGSLMCYLLGIIELDPVKFNLSFDRFLSASRGGYMLNAKME